MNSTCAGGTGAFIDQMATLLDVDLETMDQLSLQHTTLYPIASRCGVFAKSDVQPLINQGCEKIKPCGKYLSGGRRSEYRRTGTGKKYRRKRIVSGRSPAFSKGVAGAL